MNNITLYVDNVATTIDGKFPKGVYEEFKKELGYIPENALWQARANPYFKGYFTCVCWNMDKCRCSIKKDGTHFPTGLISKAIGFFALHNIPCSVVDLRDINIAKSIREVPYTLTSTLNDGKPFSLFDYQKSTIDKAISSQRGIIKVATGGGKTVIASGIISELGVKPTIFYVTSIDLLNQAVSEITQYVRLNNLKVTVGSIGGGNKKIGDITVITIQSAMKALDAVYETYDEEDVKEEETEIDDIKKDIVELIHSAKLIICDEVQHWAAKTCQTLADNSLGARWKYGLSATPWRDKGDDILIDACFGKTIVDINASFLIERGFLVKPNIAFININNTKGHKFGPYPSVYKNALVENNYRNNIIAGLASSLKEKNRNVLILIQQIVHGEILEDLIEGSIFLHGKSGKARRKDHIEELRLGKPSITIASTIFDEGIDVKPLNSLILAGGGKSSTRALQRVGRVIRNYTYPNGNKKEDAFVYDFHDVHKYLTDHSLARRKIYQSEPLFDIQDFSLP